MEIFLFRSFVEVTPPKCCRFDLRSPFPFSECSFEADLLSPSRRGGSEFLVMLRPKVYISPFVFLFLPVYVRFSGDTLSRCGCVGLSVLIPWAPF